MMLKANNRWLPLLLLTVISRAAAAERPQRMAADWPREIDARGSKIVVYEPQLESFRGGRMTSRAAVSLTRENGGEPVFGGIWLDAVMSTNTERRTVTPVVIKVLEVRFPDLSADEAARLRQVIGDEISRWNLSYSVDALLAEVKLLEEQKAAAESLKADVPQILFRNRPAVVLSIEDEPAWRKSSDSAFRRLQNSPFFVLQESSTRINYLHVPPYWWTSTNPLGIWQPVENVPDAVADVWKNDAPPQQAATESGPRPDVIALNGAAELVWTDGSPRFVPIAGTNLLYIRNTDSDVFLDIATQTTYALFSGRWYRTPQGKNAWEFVASDQLPPDFGRIPISSEKRHVLACVAGTPQAQTALKNAEIPRTEAVKPGPAPELQATYDGEPQFTDIPDIGLSYAVNTPYSIFRVPGRYYWCYDGIWYDSAFPVGPWAVCVGVPRSIYLIPPSCPHYYVTYCHIFGVSSDVVCLGTYPGYRGCYAWGSSVVYGTGWNYRTWIGNQCYTRPVSWGLGVHYSSAGNGWTLHGGGTSLTPMRRPSEYRAPQAQAGAGGFWGGGVHGYRDPSPSTSSTSPYLHPERPQHEPARTSLHPPREHPDNPRTPPPWADPDAPRAPRPLPREPHERPKDPVPLPAVRETPRTPPPPRETPRTPPPPREYRESPKTPPQAPRQDHEAPRTPPPQHEQRDAPRRQDPPPRRESQNDSSHSSDRKH